jgi:hypothetical protein
MKRFAVVMVLGSVMGLSACGEGADEVPAGAQPFSLPAPGRESVASSTQAATGYGGCIYEGNIHGDTMDQACNNSWNAGAAWCAQQGLRVISETTCSGYCWINGCWATTTTCC